MRLFVVPPGLGCCLTQNPVGDATGEKASLTLFGYDRYGLYPCPLTGACRPGLLDRSRSPGNSEVHSTLSCGQAFHQLPALCAAVSPLLVLFMVFFY